MAASQQPSQGIISQLHKDKAISVLAKSYSVSVQFCRCSCINYQPLASHDPPHIAYTAPFRKGDYIHIKEEYNKNWWIGRVVDHESQMVFIPSEEKLKCIVGEQVVYEVAPIMRPIVFLGPSIKSSKLSQLLQIPLITFMKEKFADRLTTVVSSYPLDSKENGSRADSGLEVQVYQAGRSLNLVFLDCAVSFPGELESKLHPLFIYIKVSRPKVLQRLVHQIATSSKERGELLDGAILLNKSRPQCSLIISESNVDDACQRLELFLEGYWASTRSILLT